MSVDETGTGAVAAWQSPAGVTERLIFGTHQQSAIDAAVDGFCRAQLGAAVVEVLVRASSVGVVYGVRLADGRRVIVKAFSPRESLPTLAAAQRVQARLHRAGFPCPAPLVGPVALACGSAVAEELLDDGEVRDTHDPTCRRLMAEALAWHLELARSCGRPNALRSGWSLYVRGRLWPTRAHTRAVDLRATAAGAEWIDAIAAKAKPAALAAASRASVVGHHDWSGKHFRFGHGRVTAVYDWDSVRLGAEAVIVGNAAMTFTANFDVPGLRLAPTPAEVLAFVDEYDAARSAPLSRAERDEIAACGTFIAAYAARCEHARHGGARAVENPNSYSWALRTHGDDYLRQCGRTP